MLGFYNCIYCIHLGEGRKLEPVTPFPCIRPCLCVSLLLYVSVTCLTACGIPSPRSVVPFQCAFCIHVYCQQTPPDHHPECILVCVFVFACVSLCVYVCMHGYCSAMNTHTCIIVQQYIMQERDVNDAWPATLKDVQNDVIYIFARAVPKGHWGGAISFNIESIRLTGYCYTCSVVFSFQDQHLKINDFTFRISYMCMVR